MGIIAIRDEAHWRELRAKHVGGSEVAALFNVRPFHTTHLELWLIKRGDVSGDIEDNDRMYWGRMLEEKIAQAAADKNGWKIAAPKAYYTCDDTPGMGCTPDFVILHVGDNGVLQCKMVDRLEFKKWEDGQPPLKYELQLQHELACTGLRWGALAVLIGGNELRVFVYQSHTAAQLKIKEAISAFWLSISNDEQPKAIAEDYEVLFDLYRDHGPIKDLTSDNEMPSLCAAALAAAERRKEAEKQEKQAKASIMQKVGNARFARCQGFEITRKPVTRKGFTVAETTYTKMDIKEEQVA